ncbi:glycosyl hydrolase family 18 protein [Konateibacter massiliensis]|uniref:glycosyl hydrolase family 18 protein n=1 Tax=Konateibacter massiliensis TaxID=2002841 RepID=UPI000C152EB9|nr:glycosyl hydrolase family 18 protein [Konateibacter massiliensis]
MIIHVVNQGETINSIAAQYGVSAERLITDNGIENVNRLVVGQALVVLIPETTHTVAAGETIQGIAAQYGIDEINLLQNNPALINNRTLNAGEVLVISYEGEKLREGRFNGYAYPFINMETLRTALTYMTLLTIFGYGFTETGELIPIDDEVLIREAYAFRASPMMLISSIDEEGNFSNEHAEKLFGDPVARETLITNIINTMYIKGYVGLDIDFEFIRSRENYITFIEAVTTRLHAEGFIVNVDLAPKTSADQPGLIYQAHDYARIGEIADTVLLMTYEWGYLYGPPMAVAPLDQVRRVVEYAITEIDVNKIMLGIPNYAYDWKLPYVRGESEAVIIGNTEAIDIAARYNAVIEFDTTAMTPFFYYFDEAGVQHVVWFEDARSIEAKLRLIQEYNLLGGGYWNLMRKFQANWSVLNSLYIIDKL